MKLLFLLVLMSGITITFAQKLPTCKDLHTGIFYQYPKNSGRQMEINLQEGVEKDVDMVTGDSSIYTVKWLSDCVMSEKCISSTEKAMTDHWKFVKKHTFINEITTITDAYFLINIYLDKLSDKPSETDTIWFNRRLKVLNSQLFKQTSSKELAIQPTANDTPKYALVYIYRPFKVALALASYVDYCDEEPMFSMKNNSGYIYKIFKEGIHTFQSKLYRDTVKLDVDVHFGKTYYIKSAINWAITKRLYNFQLDLQQMEHTLGAAEFAKVKERYTNE